MSETMRHTERELDILGTPADDSGRLAVEALIGTLTGMPMMDSATARDWVINIFTRVANHEVLTPLTGESHEWREIPGHQRAGDLNYQNVRESSVLAQAMWRPRYAEEVQPIEERFVNRDKDQVPSAPDEVFQIVRAVDIEGLRVQRGTDEHTGYRTWMPVKFPYMPQRFQVNIGVDDPREDVEVENEARARFSNEQVTFVKGGRTA